jgi:hypothetical protein
MSHFSVLVIVPSEEAIELGIEKSVTKRLAPFVEQIDCDEDRQYFQWVDESEEYEAKWRDENVELVRLPDREPFNGRVVFPHDREFAFTKQDVLGIKEGKEWKHALHMGSGVHYLFPIDSDLFIGKFSDIYPDYQTFLKEYAGHSEGEIGYWTNPNAKWDWWQIGGRFSGRLAGGDSIRVNELPLVEDRKRAKKKAAEYYDEQVTARIEDRYVEPDRRSLWAPWSKLMDFGLLDKEKMAEKREKLKKGEKLDPVFIDNMPTEKEFVDAFWFEWSDYTTWAVLDLEGQWHEPGQMGWWGMDSAEDGAKVEFGQGFFDKFIYSAAPDDWLVVVDCHI